MAEVVLKDICKIYDGGVMAVDHFNMTIYDKEFVVLVGPSGCGKSTTLRMIAGLEDITSGDLSIDDKIVNDVQPKDRDIAMVFQNYALYPHMSVYDNMAFGLKIRKFSKVEIKARVDDAAEILHLKDLLSRKPKALSGGQRQRVAVGRAIVRKPRVFLFDEPLSNLDAKLRVQMRTEISALHSRLQATMVYVTHDQVEAMTMGDRIVLMKDGLIQQIGTPLELYKKPDNRFVATFIGSPPMNIFSGPINVSEDSVSINTQYLKIDLELKKFEHLRAYNGRDIFVGVRPENVSLEPFSSSAVAEIAAQIEVVEPLGAETHVYLTADDHRLIMKIAPTHLLHVGESLTCYLDPKELSFFDIEDDRRIKA